LAIGSKLSKDVVIEKSRSVVCKDLQTGEKVGFLREKSANQGCSPNALCFKVIVKNDVNPIIILTVENP